ncbi:MAG: type II toxin-antitoxin system HicB family antitoxin [Geminicoccaceae bacterium]|nr:type II toxin-antitoxin system HicB family antitoxin [Geminicoccaceae bacterium]
MSVRHYVAFIEPAEGGFGVLFPDVPGCTSAGATLDEAVRNAGEALAGHFGLMIEDGDAIPEPSPINAPLPDWLQGEDMGDCVRVLVPVDLPGKAVRVNVLLEESLLARIDNAATTRGMTRSAFLADAARRAIG